jgi:hypothetical protein
MKSYFLAMVCTGAGLSALALVYLALLPLLGKRYGPRGLYRAGETCYTACGWWCWQAC